MIKKSGRRVIAVSGLFFLIFSPHLSILGVTIKTVYVFVVLPGVIGAYRFITTSKRNIVVVNTLWVLSGILLYHVVLSAIFSFYDVSVVKQLFMGFTTLFAAYFYVRVYERLYPSNVALTICQDLNLVGVIEAVIVILTFISPWFKDFLYSFVSTSALSHRYLFEPVANQRFQGIAESGFSFLSVVHALLLVIGLWAYVMDRKKFGVKRTLMFALSQVLLFVSIMLIGRSGLVIVVLFVTAMLIYGMIDFLKSRLALQRLTGLMFGVVVVLYSASIVINVSKYKRNISYAFELYYSLTTSGTLDRSSANVVEHQFIFPHNPFDLMFGTGNFGRGANFPYVMSDVGYVLFINGAGVLGMFVSYCFLLPGLYYARKYRRQNLFLSRFFAVFTVGLCILNVKDYYYFAYGDTFQIYFIMLCTLGTVVESRKALALSNMTSRRLDRYECGHPSLAQAPE